MKEIFDEDQYVEDVTKETVYFYFPKTFLDLLCYLRAFFLFSMFFHLTDSESEFRRPLKEFWKTLESPLKNSILLFCTVAHIKEVCAVCNTVSFPKQVLLRNIYS